MLVDPSLLYRNTFRPKGFDESSGRGPVSFNYKYTVPEVKFRNLLGWSELYD